MVCCIFMASRTSTRRRPRPGRPAATATLTTVPGIGASRLPLGDRVGRVGEAGDLAEPRGPSRPVDVELSGVPGAAGEMCPRVSDDAVDLEHGRASATRTVTPSTAKPSRVPHHSTGRAPRRWCAAAETTLRQAAGCPAERYGARRRRRPASALRRSPRGGARTGLETRSSSRDSSSRRHLRRGTGVRQDVDQLVAVGHDPVDPGPPQGRRPAGGRPARGWAPTRRPWRASRRSGSPTSLPDSKPESTRIPCSASGPRTCVSRQL